MSTSIFQTTVLFFVHPVVAVATVKFPPQPMTQIYLTPLAFIHIPCFLGLPSFAGCEGSEGIE